MSIYKNGEKYNVVVGNIPSEDNLDKLLDQSIEEIHSTTPAKYGEYMFYNQHRLRIADIVLSEDITSNSAYAHMFQGCTSLTTAPDLPATTLTSGCYDSMFRGCTSLQKTGKIYATGFIYGRADNMFAGCTSLREMTWMATIPPIINLNIWTGCPSDMIIYVPDESVDVYKTANGWITRADYIKPMSEKPTE